MVAAGAALAPDRTRETRMKRILLPAILTLLGNALGLWIASLLLDDMSVDGVAFLVAVLIFTGLMVVLHPLVTKLTADRAGALEGASALITTFLGLLVTELVSDGLEISGLGTWVLATVIVWVAALLAGVVLPRLLVRDAPADGR
jgi:uncharacterized membrane protein YvlD (DUF360 family)